MGGMAPRKDSRPSPSDPDLFSVTPKAAVEAGSPVAAAISAPAVSPRFILPQDLDRALAYLTAEDLQRLRDAVERQCQQRGMVDNGGHGKPPAASLPANSGSTMQPGPEAKIAKTKGEAVALTQSKINAIRAAFKAGVKPTLICRQFGVSQAAIRQALKED